MEYTEGPGQGNIFTFPISKFRDMLLISGLYYLGRSTSSVGGSSKVAKAAHPHKRLKRKLDDGEPPKSKRKKAKKRRVEQDHTTSESSKGASISQM